jgi:hypothetical protein
MWTKKSLLNKRLVHAHFSKTMIYVSGSSRTTYSWFGNVCIDVHICLGKKKDPMWFNLFRAKLTFDLL